ncbi:hypothetical protein I316_01141 [Kwoniella heveanensis BCC8398]|uniref:Uncharacterized protein n=1 Tax=Kwoniella heveanensis BCC8398 TaxID=1296120 RepID=A0A1B9H1W0_9TREE|nr:hypothetical protein I316_01141 [Kwoniella heveanensis BCC8398]
MSVFPHKAKGMKRPHSNLSHRQPYPPLSEDHRSTTIAIGWTFDNRSIAPCHSTATITPIDEDARPYEYGQVSQDANQMIRQAARFDDRAIADQKPTSSGLRPYPRAESTRIQNASPSFNEESEENTLATAEDEDLKPPITHFGSTDRQASFANTRNAPLRISPASQSDSMAFHKTEDQPRAPGGTQSTSVQVQSPTHRSFLPERPGDRLASFFFDSQRMANLERGSSHSSSRNMARAIPGTSAEVPPHPIYPTHVGPGKGKTIPGSTSSRPSANDDVKQEFRVSHGDYGADECRGGRGYATPAYRSTETTSRLSHWDESPARQTSPHPVVNMGLDSASQAYRSAGSESFSRGTAQSSDKYAEGHSTQITYFDRQGPESLQARAYTPDDRQITQPAGPSVLKSPIVPGPFNVPGLLLQLQTPEIAKHRCPQSTAVDVKGEIPDHPMSRFHTPEQHRHVRQEGRADPAFHDPHERQYSNESDESFEPHQSYRAIQNDSAVVHPTRASSPQSRYEGYQDAQRSMYEYNRKQAATDHVQEYGQTASEQPEDPPETKPDPLFPIPAIVSTPVILLAGMDCVSIWQERLDAVKGNDQEPSWSRVRDLRSKQGNIVNAASNHYETMFNSLVNLQGVKDRELKRKTTLTERYRGAISNLYGQFANAQNGGSLSAKRRKVEER